MVFGGKKLLQNKHITLYVTGSIAAYKALILTRLLVQAQADVRVVMTAAAEKFVTPLSFQTLSKHKVLTQTFSTENPEVQHIELAEWTDLAIVAPASADFIAKMAQGRADDFASLTLLATVAPKFIAPAMNNHMLAHAAVQRNLHSLQNDGTQIIAPETGFLAEGSQGCGRMAEPDHIVAELFSNLLVSSTLKNKKIVVTAGGTRESLDPVRFLANKSSGKMGYAIAQVLQQRGAEVVLISGPTNLTPPAGVQRISITSAQQMLTAVVQEFQSSAALIMAAAVADFRPEHLAQQKIKKTSTDNAWNLKLVKTADILQAVAQIKHPSQTTIGFAAETQNLMTNALQKLENKKLDLVVANDVSKTNVGFNSDNNQVTFIKQGQKPWTTAILPKVQIAEQIADQLEILMQQKSILK